MTPIPPGLARPLIESLECDAVMRNSDIDTIIEPPPGGLTGYRRAVTLALNRTAPGPPATTWASLESRPAELLPSDPSWAGQIVHTAVRTAVTAARPDDVWKAAENAANSSGRWSVAERKPATLLLRSTKRSPGTAWLEVTVTPHVGGGSTYTQRAIFVPIGIVGRLYWFLARPFRAVALSALAREVVRSASKTAEVSPRTSGATRPP